MESIQDPNIPIDHYKTIFENALEGIYQSSPEGRYLRVNPALARMYGYSDPDELLNGVEDIPHQIYVDPEKRLEFESQMERENRVIGLEYQIRRKQGDTLWISEAARAVRDHSGKLLYYEGFIQDISARKRNEEIRSRLEERLKNAQKLEAIGALARGVAHDFNNILAGIIGYTEIALDSHRNPQDTESYLQEILAGSRRARDLVSKMLYFSQQSFPRKKRMSAQETIQRALQAAPAPKNVQVHFDDSTSLKDCLIEGDPDQIKLVVIHILENAYNALKGINGNIFIELEMCSEPEQETDTEISHLNESAGIIPHWTRIIIQDDGPGISQENLEHIFDPFFTTQPVGQGSGLGLSVCHGIVKSHGGFIQALSEPNQGTKLILSLPAGVLANDETATSDQVDQRFSKTNTGINERSAPEARVGLLGRKVMIVDDEPAILSILKRKLGALGASISVYSDPRAALETFHTQPGAFDIIITDYSMPNLSGVDLAEKIKASRPEIPIIICTGYSDATMIQSWGQTSQMERLMKPFEIPDLQRLITKLLNRVRSVEAEAN